MNSPQLIAELVQSGFDADTEGNFVRQQGRHRIVVFPKFRFVAELQRRVGSKWKPQTTLDPASPHASVSAATHFDFTAL